MNQLFRPGELRLIPHPPFRLTLFGSPCITGSDDLPLAGRATQRHRIALLTLLALAPGMRVSRDQLAGYLWPESDEAHARSLLNQAVYIVRRALGESSIQSLGDELQLNASIVEVDVRVFEGAKTRGDHARMAALYRGAFLDGFFLDDAPEFVDRIENERRRFASEYARAIELLAESAERQGDALGSIEWWQARALLDPYDSRVALRLMEALASSGNPAGAIHQGELHQRALRTEFGIDPPSDVIELTERLRTAGGSAQIRLPRPAHPPLSHASEQLLPPGPQYPAEEPTRQRPAGRRRSRASRSGLVLLAIGCVILTDLWHSPAGDSSAVTSIGVRSILVLPLASRDLNDGPLAFGLTDELVARLATLDGLRVIAPVAPGAFPDGQSQLRERAARLGIGNVLEGAIQRSGSRLRVRLRLVDPGDGAVRWSGSFDRELQDVFAVQDEIAETVASQLGLELRPGANVPGRRRPTQNIAAYEFYLRGNDLTLLRSDSGSLRVLDYFQRALALDSAYAEAYAGLATAYVRLAATGPRLGLSIDEMQHLAEEAARRALALDDSLARAHLVYAVTRQQDWDYAEAEAHLQRALELDPSQPLTHEALVELYLVTGRIGEALAQAEWGLEVDPLSPGTTAELARALLANGRCDEALARLQAIADVRPQLLRVPPIVAQCHAMKGRWAEAIAAIRAVVPASPGARGMLGYLLARAGHREEARELRTRLAREWQDANGDAVHVAVISAGLGELDEAFFWLERAVEDGSIAPIWGYSGVLEPIFAELHRDPRFERVREALGIN